MKFKLKEKGWDLKPAVGFAVALVIAFCLRGLKEKIAENQGLLEGYSWSSINDDGAELRAGQQTSVSLNKIEGSEHAVGSALCFDLIATLWADDEIVQRTALKCGKDGVARSESRVGP